MKVLALVIILPLWYLSAGADDKIDIIYRYYHDGALRKAEAEFQQLPTTAIRDGNRLFVSALLARNAAEAREFLLAALKSDLDGKYQEDAYFRLMQIAEAGGDTSEVLRRGEHYLEHWETGKYRLPVLLAMAAHVKPSDRDYDRFSGLLIDENPGGFYGQAARLMKAFDDYSGNKIRAAETMCRKINNAANDDLSPASLLLLSQIAIKDNDYDRALLNYNILREQYPHCIGQGRLLSVLKNVSEEKSGAESKEVFEGITYSVQVGVFSSKDNAQDMADRVEAYGYKARIGRKNISGKTYYVTLAGKFKTMNDAEVARQRLEAGEGEVYRVVVNDD